MSAPETHAAAAIPQPPLKPIVGNPTELDAAMRAHLGALAQAARCPPERAELERLGCEEVYTNEVLERSGRARLGRPDGARALRVRCVRLSSMLASPGSAHRMAR